MKIVDQARLGFREGKSDKLYEIDLVEVAADQYVVNFRFGRRGSALRDGTKTPLPVPLEKARAVFASLVAEKTKGGYKPLAADASSRSARAQAPERAKELERELIAELSRGHRARQPLHLVVRKVGERALEEAEPFLLELLASGSPESQSKPEALRHFVVAALARCGSSRALGALRTLSNDEKQPRHLRDVALLAACMLGGEEERAAALARVPATLKPQASGDVGERTRAAEELLAKDAKRAHSAIFALYASTARDDSDAARAARGMVLATARLARMTGIELGLLRTLNWAAEIRRDPELFAVLSRRFENEAHVKAETRNYFKRRAARTLRRLGSIGSADYVRLATALLLLYRESDAEAPIRSERGVWDAFARYHALNFVVHGNSPRYAPAGHRRATWRRRAGYVHNVSVREESFPELWDRAPDALWRLGISDAASIVIAFATRALRDQTAFLSAVEDVELARALAGAQRPMRILAFETARLRPLNLVLARAALAAELDEADSWVLAWLDATPSLLHTHADLLALLLTAKSERVRRHVPRDLLFSPTFARELVTATVALLMSLGDDQLANERAQSAASFLLDRCADALNSLGLEVIKDLAFHSVANVAEFGAELLARRAKQGALADDLLDALLASPHASVRSIGARIVAETPPDIMKDEPELLLHLALSDNAELRAGTRKLLGDVARLYPDVGARLASELIDALLTRQPEGAPAHVVSLLRHELAAKLPKRDARSVLALIGALSPHAREVGGLLLSTLGPDELELEQIVRLANHEILMVRQGAWALARAAKERFRVAPIALAHLCDARWEDSRAFAFEFVRSFPADVLAPDIVIAICDSIDPAVQRFGQTLLTEYWREEHAARYLLRLSEHPATNIQLLVSGLLDRYARGNLELLQRLLPCLQTVLSQVNRGAVAKQRVLSFLRSEAIASAEAATMLAPLLERQSLTRAISHKAPLIATMVAVQEHYPKLALPIELPAVPLHSRSNRGI